MYIVANYNTKETTETVSFTDAVKIAKNMDCGVIASRSISWLYFSKGRFVHREVQDTIFLDRIKQCFSN